MQTQMLRHYDLHFTDRVTRLALDDGIENLCRAAHLTQVLEARDTSVLFDLSGCWFIDLDAAHWLLNLIRALLSGENNQVALRLPEVDWANENNIWSFLIRWRFFDALSNVAGSAADLLAEDQASHIFDTSRYRESVRVDAYGKPLPLLTSRLLAIAGAFVDRTFPLEPQLAAFVSPVREVLLLQALAQSCKINHENAGTLISFIAEEGCTNAILHAEGDYVLTSMQIVDGELPRLLQCAPHLEIIISDNGMGIPDVLRLAAAEKRISKTTLPEDHSELIELFASQEISVDSAIIAAATKPGVASNPLSRGLGLHHLITYAADLNGEVTIRSGHAAVQFEGAEVTKQYSKFTESLGTVITVTIPFPV
jgi:anti-sigma regulatory factor (Ser/Thr protein kinase)